MTIVFNDGTTNYSPANLIVDGYEPEADVRNIVHRIINGPDSYTLRTPGLRAGDLKVLMSSRASAFAFYTALRAKKLWTFADSDQSELAMSFIPMKTLKPRLDNDTRDDWWVDLGYQEVTP